MKKIFTLLMIFYFFITKAFGTGDFSLWCERSVPKIPQMDEVAAWGVDYMHDIHDSWKIGARVEYLGGEFSTVSSNVKVHCNPYFKAVMIGGGYNKSIGKNFNLNGKSFLGCSFVHVHPKEIPYTISSKIFDVVPRFVGELSMGIQYLFTKRFGLGFDVGYRFVPEITIQDVKGTKDIKIDFSGATFALGLSYKI